jgi:hypothetical protein
MLRKAGMQPLRYKLHTPAIHSGSSPVLKHITRISSPTRICGCPGPCTEMLADSASLGIL